MDKIKFIITLLYFLIVPIALILFTYLFFTSEIIVDKIHNGILMLFFAMVMLTDKDARK